MDENPMTASQNWENPGTGSEVEEAKRQDEERASHYPSKMGCSPRIQTSKGSSPGFRTTAGPQTGVSAGPPEDENDGTVDR